MGDFFIYNYGIDLRNDFMTFKEFVEFIAKYSNNNFGYVNEPELVAVYGIIEEWGEFIGEYKRLVRDDFSVEAICAFGAKAPIEWADTIAYWVIRMWHLNFGIIDYEDVDDFDLGLYDTLDDANRQVTISMGSMFLCKDDPYELLNNLFCVGNFLDGGIENAFEMCAEKLRNREKSGNVKN